ncbi:MAG: alpha/beta fold hydrolase [Coriobacteriia bacterium]
MGRKMLKVALVVFGSLILVLAVASAGAYLLPNPTPPSQSNPAKSYGDAVARIDAARAADGPEIGYHQIFIGQGSKTATAVVLFHGFTNAPRQMDVLVRAYAARGYNVYVPRLPHHGLSDRMTEDLKNQSVGELAKAVDDAIDIGAGLGDTVVVSGLSAGGTMSAWAAKNRSEVGEAVLIAPLIQPMPVPTLLSRPLYQYTPHIPPLWVWWNPLKKENQKEPAEAYPRYTLASLGDFMAMADSVAHDPPQRQGDLGRMVLVTNAADPAVRNDIATQVLEREFKPITKEWVAFEIPANLKWKHDVIDPKGENRQHITEIYRTLLPLYGLETTTSLAPTGTP